MGVKTVSTRVIVTAQETAPQTAPMLAHAPGATSLTNGKHRSGLSTTPLTPVGTSTLDIVAVAATQGAPLTTFMTDCGAIYGFFLAWC